MRPHRSVPCSPRIRTLPRRSRATSTVSRAKNSRPSTIPAGMLPLRWPEPANCAAVPIGSPGFRAEEPWCLAPRIADFLARGVAAPLVDVELFVRLLVHRLPVHARLPRRNADAEVDAHRQLGRSEERRVGE